MRVTVWPSNSTPGHISRKDNNSNLKGIWTSAFIAALFTVAKTWMQPKRSLTVKWVKRMGIYICHGMLLGHKKEWNNAICSNMDGPRDYLPSEVGQTKNTNIIWYHLDVRSHF